MTLIPIEKKVLSENQRIATSLRDRFQAHGTLCLNLVSSPGSGKTMLLEHTLGSFDSDKKIAVLTGDLQTDNDARRLARFGFPVQQITTGTLCHLDGKMIERALENWRLDDIELLLIENVGNLVCPSSYDLGEDAKVVLLSVTEGEDKPQVRVDLCQGRASSADKDRLASTCAIRFRTSASPCPAGSSGHGDPGAVLHDGPRCNCVALVAGAPPGNNDEPLQGAAAGVSCGPFSS